MADVIKNGLKSLFLATKGAVTGEDQYVSEEIQEARQNICNGCTHRNKALNQCKKCKCFISFKSRLKRESCPIDKWKAEY